MQLSISGLHMDVTDALKSYVTGKLEKLERHYDHITNVHVVL
ncbi:MAG: ribosome-associated translation inhibitor RaiA, partial [Proteobacteria bacterium]|nr:ribosome-associated translation inhibitor RaiA [Pseudomonadota bacterium]